MCGCRSLSWLTIYNEGGAGGERCNAAAGPPCSEQTPALPRLRAHLSLDILVDVLAGRQEGHAGASAEAFRVSKRAAEATCSSRAATHIGPAPHKLERQLLPRHLVQGQQHPAVRAAAQVGDLQRQRKSAQPGPQAAATAAAAACRIALLQRLLVTCSYRGWLLSSGSSALGSSGAAIGAAAQWRSGILMRARQSQANEALETGRASKAAAAIVPPHPAARPCGCALHARQEI